MNFLHFPAASSKRVYKKRDWMKLNIAFTLTDEEWYEVFGKENKKFITGTYVDFFAKKSIPLEFLVFWLQSTKSLKNQFHWYFIACTLNAHAFTK